MRKIDIFLAAALSLLAPTTVAAADIVDSTATESNFGDTSDIITGPGSKKIEIKGGKAGRLRVYGEVSNFASYQTRSGIMDEIGLIYLLPADQNLNSLNIIDLNDVATFRYLSLGSKLGVNWYGCRFGKMSMGARIEGDFYCTTGSRSAFRLRYAYLDLAWDFGKAGKLGVLAGQNWHPLALERPDVLSMNRGAPFNPYSHAPQLKIDYQVLDWLNISIAAMWQANFRSTGPDGVSGKYMEWSCCPECFLGLDFKYKGLYARAGANFLSIKPRLYAKYLGTDVDAWVTDRANFLSGFAYAEYNWDNWTVKAKSVISQGGEHLSLMGGYGISAVDDYGNRSYTPYMTSSSWASGSYSLALGKSSLFKFSLMAAYLQNLGARHLVTTSESYVYYSNDCTNLLRAARCAPNVEYRFKYLRVGIEYEFTAAQYGDRATMSLENGLARNNLRWLYAHNLTILLGVAF